MSGTEPSPTVPWFSPPRARRHTGLCWNGVWLRSGEVNVSKKPTLHQEAERLLKEGDVLHPTQADVDEYDPSSTETQPATEADSVEQPPGGTDEDTA